MAGILGGMAVGDTLLFTQRQKSKDRSLRQLLQKTVQELPQAAIF